MKQFEVKRKQIEYLSKALEIVLLLAIERKLKLEGMGFFLIPILLFSMVWTFVGESLPDVLAKLIRIRRAKGQHKSVTGIRWYSLVCQIVMGLLGSFLLLGLGSLLGERVYGCPYCSLMIWILSPLPFLRGMTNLLLGYCQGEGFELPAVISCLLRIVVIYGFGVILGSSAGEYGEKVSALLKVERYVAMYVGAGWCLAIVMAELVMILFLFFSFLGTRRKKQNAEAESMKASVSLQGYVGAVSRNMIFKILVNFCELFPVGIGMMIYYHREGETAPLTYGTFFVGYLAVCVLLYRLLCAVIVPYWGKIAALFKQDEVRLGRTCFHGGLQLFLGLSASLSVTISAMASQVGALAGFTSPNLVKVVVPGSFLLIFLSLGFYFSRLLMRFGKNLLVLGMGILSDVVFVMIFLIFWTDEKMGLLALMYAGLFSYGIYAILLGVISVQLIGGRLNWLKVIVLPLGLGAALEILEVLCVRFIGEKLEGIYVVALVGGLGFVVYWCSLLLLRGFTEEELSVMPFGEVLRSLGKMLGLFSE